MSKDSVKIIFATSDASKSHPLQKIKEEVKDARDRILADAWRKRWIDIVERQNFEYTTLDTELNADGDRDIIFHYAGHSDANGLLIKTSSGETNFGTDDFATLLEAHKNRIRLVFLNGCYSEEIAQKLTGKGIRYVIGTSGKINDQISAQVAREFYLQMISTEKTIDLAYRACKNFFLQADIQSDLSAAFRGFDKGDAAAFPWQLKAAENLTAAEMAWTLRPSRKRSLLLSGEYGASFMIRVLCLYNKQESVYFEYLQNNLRDDASKKYIIHGLWEIFDELDRDDLITELDKADLVIHIINGGSYVRLLNDLSSIGVKMDEYGGKKHFCLPIDKIPQGTLITNNKWYSDESVIPSTMPKTADSFFDIEKIFSNIMTPDSMFNTFFKTSIENILKKELSCIYVEPSLLADDLKQMRFMNEEKEYSCRSNQQSNIEFILIEGTPDCAQRLLISNIVHTLNNLKNKKPHPYPMYYKPELNTDGEFWTYLYYRLELDKIKVSEDQYPEVCIGALLGRLESEDIVLVFDDMNSSQGDYFKKTICNTFLSALNKKYNQMKEKSGQTWNGKLFIFAVNYDVQKSAFRSIYKASRNNSISISIISPVTVFNTTECNILFNVMKTRYVNNVRFKKLETENQHFVIEKHRKTAMQLICEELKCDFTEVSSKVLQYD